MLLKDAIEKTRKALCSFVEEHGAPNRVLPSELWADHNGPSPMNIGKAAPFMWDAIPGHRVRYQNRCFAIEVA